MVLKYDNYMEEMIRFVIFNNLSEVGDRVSSLDGLCFYFANNIMADLEMLEIPVEMYNINNGYDHYYLIADNEYLIDPTYRQFLKTNEVSIIFEDFPANILKKDERGNVILNDLLEDGYHKLEKGDMNIYLSSFKVKERHK